MKNTTHNLFIRGVGIVEAIIVISIVSVSFTSIISAGVFFIRGGLHASDQAQALFLLDEGVEAIRFLRNESYTMNIAPHIGAGDFYLTLFEGQWVATTTNTLILGKFTRTVECSEVYRRNSDDDIVPVSSGDPKTLDPSTVFLTVKVSWSGNEITTTTYVSDLYEN